jgi:hypothetical protein
MPAHEATQLGALNTVLHESLSKENRDLKERVRQLEEAQMSPHTWDGKRMTWKQVAALLQKQVAEARSGEEHGWGTMHRAETILEHARTYAGRAAFDLAAANEQTRPRQHIEVAHSLICEAIYVLREDE